MFIICYVRHWFLITEEFNMSQRGKQCRLEKEMQGKKEKHDRKQGNATEGDFSLTFQPAISQLITNLRRFLRGG